METKKFYTVEELAKIWHEITTQYKLVNELYNEAKSNMIKMQHYISTKITNDDMIKIFEYLNGIDKNNGNDIVNLIK